MALPANYEELRWYDKRDCFDPIDLACWCASHFPRLVPTRDEAAHIKLREAA